MFTLKIRELNDYLVSDDRHDMGGVDLLQRAAFHHLMPAGECHWGMRSLLYDMAHLHGWDVKLAENSKDTS